MGRRCLSGKLTAVELLPKSEILERGPREAHILPRLGASWQQASGFVRIFSLLCEAHEEETRAIWWWLEGC